MTELGEKELRQELRRLEELVENGRGILEEESREPVAAGDRVFGSQDALGLA